MEATALRAARRARRPARLTAQSRPITRARLGIKHGQRSCRRVRYKKARPTGGTSDNDASTTGPPSLNPCTLVSIGQAKAITGGTVSGSFEAPLGPTCVYKAGRPRTDITIDIESVSLAQAASHMTKRKQLTVSGHRAYCGTLGSQMLFVPLPGGKLLHVTAPCGVAQQFATLALGRLAA